MPGSNICAFEFCIKCAQGSIFCHHLCQSNFAHWVSRHLFSIDLNLCDIASLHISNNTVIAMKREHSKLLFSIVQSPTMNVAPRVTNSCQGHNPNMSELHHCRNGLLAMIGHSSATYWSLTGHLSLASANNRLVLKIV